MTINEPSQTQPSQPVEQAIPLGEMEPTPTNGLRLNVWQRQKLWEMLDHEGRDALRRLQDRGVVGEQLWEAGDRVRQVTEGSQRQAAFAATVSPLGLLDTLRRHLSEIVTIYSE
jgi:hypothetical protein